MSESIDKEELLVSIREKYGPEFVSMKDLECPTSDFMMRYFSAVISSLGIDFNEKQECNSLRSLPHADSYIYVRQYFNVYNIIREVFPVKELLTNFSMFCLLEPKPADIKYVAIIDNFDDFWYDRVEKILKPCLMELDAMQNRLSQKQQQHAEMQQKINDCAARQGKREIEQAKIEKQIAELKPEVEELEMKVAQMELAVSEAETERNQLSEERDRCRESMEAENESKRLEEEIKTLRTKLAEQEQVLDEKRTFLQEKASRLRFLESCLNDEQQIMQATVGHIALATQADERTKALNESIKKKELILRKVEAENSVLKELKARKFTIEEENQSLERNLENLEKTMNDRGKKYEDSLLSIQKCQKEIAFYDTRIKDVKEKNSKKPEELEVLNDSFRRAYDAFCEKAEAESTFHNDLRQKFMKLF